MGWTKPLHTAMMERLISWYLFHRKFPMSVDQLIDMTEVMTKQFRSPADPKKYEEFTSLRSHVRAEIFKRSKLNEQIKSKPLGLGITGQ